MCSVQCAVCSVQCVVCSVQCAVCSSLSGAARGPTRVWVVVGEAAGARAREAGGQDWLEEQAAVSS